ncbi:hypothetical protein G6F22_017399 [Rhizopus arrhizus]|nr:hypothetical protein G6F22_017399 [Rhizopus arrhizus]
MPQCAQRTMDSGAAGAGWLRRALFCAPACFAAAMRAAMRATNSTAMIRTTQNSNLPTSASMQNHFQHEPAAGVRQNQESKARQGPAQGYAAAPAPEVAAGQQYAERQPGQQGEEGLVVKGQDLAGQLHGRDRPGSHGQRQHNETDPDDTEQQLFLHQQRGLGVQHAANDAAAAMVIRP